MNAVTPLPTQQDVRELVEGLLGRHVDAYGAHEGVKLERNRENLVGTYVTDEGRVNALVMVDVACAARVGAALGLTPKGTADDAVKQGILPVQLGENVAEVLNVAASLFNTDGAPHLRLLSVYGGDIPAPADVVQWSKRFTPRVDLELDVSGYGSGIWSVVIV